MVPLSWAMATSLEYKPSNPIHFMVYQLLKWSCNNISEVKKDNVQQLVALFTIKMDHKLIVSITYNNLFEKYFILLKIILQK